MRVDESIFPLRYQKLVMSKVSLCGEKPYLFNGTASLLATWPVSVAATLTRPSVPAEKRCSPS